MNSLVWYEQVSIARPMVSERDQNAKQRKVFPTEVRSAFSFTIRYAKANIVQRVQSPKDNSQMLLFWFILC